MLQANVDVKADTIGGELAECDVAAKGVSPGLGGHRRRRRRRRRRRGGKEGWVFRWRKRRRLMVEDRGRRGGQKGGRGRQRRRGEG